MHLVGVNVPWLDQLIYFGDGYPTGHRGERIEVARGALEHKIPVPVALGGAH